jgi:hypothetical protein
MQGMNGDVCPGLRVKEVPPPVERAEMTND